ncbi:MAG: helix-turn-helix domain-containing protein [Propionicimonas sp.]|nr:helix-turn-helix domain-containing protein [Propionicimonas sp.]
MADVKTGSDSSSPSVRPLQKDPIGAEALKAFAHPLRMALYTALTEDGPATATQLAERLGESTGQTSYHLRQLARHGFVEDDPGHSGGRERWWRTASFSIDDPAVLADPGATPSVRRMFELMIGERVRALQDTADALVAGNTVDPDIALLASSAPPMTPAEAKEMLDATQARIEDHVARAKAKAEAGDTTGRQRIRIHFDVLPQPPAD